MNTNARKFVEEFTEEVKQLCKDFSDRQNRPYMGDVVSALDALRDRTLQFVAEVQAESVPVHTPTSSDEVATLRSALKEMTDRNHAVAALILDNDREGAVRWARGLVLRTNSFVEVGEATKPVGGNS